MRRKRTAGLLAAALASLAVGCSAGDEDGKCGSEKDPAKAPGRASGRDGNPGCPALPESFDTTKTLSLPGGRRLDYAYCAVADTGVGLTLRDAGGRAVWRTTCNALGVSHSKYRHQAVVELDGRRLKVTSRASAGSFVEAIDLRTGKQLRRETSDQRLRPREAE